MSGAYSILSTLNQTIFLEEDVETAKLILKKSLKKKEEL